MAKLAGCRLIAMEKVSAYLLNPAHPSGGSKARFFIQFGFDRAKVDRLIEALLDHPQNNPIVSEMEGEFGTKRVIECHLKTPDGRNPCIRSVWLIEHGDDVHRFITAVPLPE